MGKKDSKMYYAPLQVYFNDDMMSIDRFANIEAVLYLLLTHADAPEPEKAYLLFSQYQLIGIENGTMADHQLQLARYTLGCYRSRKYWQDDLDEYRSDAYNGFRAFTFKCENDKTVLIVNEEKTPLSYEERIKEWEKHWLLPDVHKEEYPIAGEGTYCYYTTTKEGFEKSERIKVSFSENTLVAVEPEEPIGNRNINPIVISISELLECAEEMRSIDPTDYCYEILRSNAIKSVENGKVSLCDKFTIAQTINIVGMVGAGKSTLIKVFAYWANKNGKRIVIVLDTVAEVFNLWRYLNKLSVNCSPLVGRSERLKYINQIADSNKTCLPISLSQYLTNACLVDGMNDGDEASLAYGKEPCFSLKELGKSKAFLCPYFNVCPGAKMLRDCYTASVVLTSVAGFAISRVGKAREPFLDVALRKFDIVIFDESDRVQKTLDQLFMPETSFNHYIKESANDCARYMNMSGFERERDRASQEYSELQLRTTGVMSCLTKALNWNLGKWNKLSAGEPFSALTLLDDLKKDERYQIPDKIYRDIYTLIDNENDNPNLSNTLREALNASCMETDFRLFNTLYKRWIGEEKSVFDRTKMNAKMIAVQDARIKLVICLIFFDHFIRKLSDAYAACHETSYGQNEIFGFLQTRFQDQQKHLPSALCGNLFGMKKNEQGDIILFRQFAFGRSLMKDLPYLQLDETGKAIGPHVIMLSGSSWAEGSYEYHINRPVNYILEADSDKREFLSRTKFYESGFSERVSGSGEMRIEMLKKVTEKSASDIIEEYNRNAGKILIIVNSYEQATIVQETLVNTLHKKQCSARVYRMISDAMTTDDSEGVIRRGEVSRFASMPAEILIAPAMAIERGHNIVDETGHSALGAVFFFVRPMSVPDDVQEKGSKLNGYMEAHCKRNPGESIWEYNMRMRQEASKRWSVVTRSGNYGLDNLSEDDKKDIVSTLFILILQIFGRLARVTDTSKPAPHVYFIDGAFRKAPDTERGFDCLTELGTYLDNMMQAETSCEIANTLYKPFYDAFKKGVNYGR